MSRLICFSGFILIFASVALCDDKPLVTVYYESLCPDSIRFVTEKLFPSYKSALKNYYDLKMVPFGKAKFVSGSDRSTWKFTCHHGERECYGNKVHGCALDRLHDMDMSMRFIVCLMKKTLEDKYAPYPVEECANQNNINSRDIIQCANYTDGNEVLKKYQEETDNFMMPLTNVPTISINGKYDRQVQELAVNNLDKAVCEHIAHPPHICHEHNKAATSTLGILTVALFFAARLLY